MFIPFVHYCLAGGVLRRRADPGLTPRWYAAGGVRFEPRGGRAPADGEGEGGGEKCHITLDDSAGSGREREDQGYRYLFRSLV